MPTSTPRFSVDRAIELVCDLVALKTVNPMGRDYGADTPVERPVTEYIEAMLAPFDVVTLRQSCSPIHENFLVCVEGRNDGPATLFESHADTVPADDWADRAFRPRIEGKLVYGRGACDDKASLAGMLMALIKLLESGMAPSRSVLFLSAGDEEYGQQGIRHFVKTNEAPIGRGIFGEPTQLVPVVQHKGPVRWDITIHGRSAHTARPELGRNAILDTMRVIEALGDQQREFQERFPGGLAGGPTLTVTMIHGGRTRNAVPDECTIAVDMRIAPGMNSAESLADVQAGVNRLGLELTHSEPQIIAPPLNTAPDDPITSVAVSACSACLGRAVAAEGAPYGTDAAWLSEAAPAIVLGPGSIDTAHAIDEVIDATEVARSAEIYYRLMVHDWD